MIRLTKVSGKNAIVLLAIVAMALALANSKQVRQAAQKGLAILEVKNKAGLTPAEAALKFNHARLAAQLKAEQ